ncbi:MAG TPA: ester cyclase [Polyangiaceae bacterium]|nr:ester cyclase [Polyangiaceae bacterium]
MASENGYSARVEANHVLGRRFFAEQDRLRGGPAPELCAPGYVAHLGGNPPTDRAGHEGFAKAFYGAFPDMRHEVEQVVAEEDALVVRFVLRGTHQGSFFGISATGRSVMIAAHVLMRVERGVVTELFGIFDEAGLLRQLGVLPG